MNARELLREARAELAKVHDHLMELTAKLPMQYFGLVDGNIIQAEDCLINKLDAYLAAQSESAMEMGRKIREGFISQIQSGESKGWLGMFYKLSDIEAAAEIEGYGRRVPRAMLEELCNYAWGRGDSNEYCINTEINEISAKHGVVIE